MRLDRDAARWLVKHSQSSIALSRCLAKACDDIDELIILIAQLLVVKEAALDFKNAQMAMLADFINGSGVINVDAEYLVQVISEVEKMMEKIDL